MIFSRRPATTNVLQPTLVRYLSQHRRALQQSLHHMARRKCLNSAVITLMAILMALPLLLWLLTDNLQQLQGAWNHSTSANLYLAAPTPESTREQLQQQLQQHPMVASVAYVSPTQGLDQIKQDSSMAPLLKVLDDNPLPGTLAITPKTGVDPDQFMALIHAQQSRHEVESIFMPGQWIRQLDTGLHLAQVGLILLGSMLAGGLILIIGNMIYLVLEQSAEEISIYALLGASKGYIRRSHLYLGACYGGFAAIVCWISLYGCFVAGRDMLDQFAQLYQLQWHLPLAIEQLIAATVTLASCAGWLAARLASRHCFAQYFPKQTKV